MCNLTNKNAGFTLVELMVSVAIFTIVVVVGLGSIMTTNRVYQNTVSQGKAIDSLSFVMDTMARRIRTGLSYSCGSTSCSSTGTSSFNFEDQDQNSIIYELASDGSGDYIQRTTTFASGGGTVIQALTSTSVIDIQDMTFYVSGETNLDSLQPRVQLVVQGQTVYGVGVSDFSLQTTVMQRQLDVE